MGRTKNKPRNNLNTAISETYSTVNSIKAESLLASFDLPAAEFFALVTQSVDRHRLRVFDTHTGTVNNDFSSDKEDKFTCLTWGKIYDGDLNGKVDTPPPKKKKKLSSQIQQFSKVIALGLQNGSIAIYSIAHGGIIKTLSGSHKLPINNFIFSKNGKKAYSCAEDAYIVEWDFEKGDMIRTYHQVVGFTIKTSSQELHWALNDDICVSTAEHDRFINIWQCKGNEPQGVGFSALTLDEDTKGLSISKFNAILAISETGIINIFRDVNSHSPVQLNKKKKRFTTQTPDCVIKVLNENDNTVIPILSACFLDENENEKSGFIMIARGSTVKPIFEKVRFIDEKNGEFLPNVTLVRHPSTGFLVDEFNLAAKNLAATQKPYDESKATVSSSSNYEIPKPPAEIDKPTQNSSTQNSLTQNSLTQNSLTQNSSTQNSSNQEETLETRLKELDLMSVGSENSQKSSHAPKFKTLQGNSMQQMLVQALHSNDDHLFNLVLEQTNPEIVNNTVRKLPTKYIIPFLEKVITRFYEKPKSVMNMLQWIKAVTLIHMTYLMTVPDLTRKLSEFYQALDSRSAIFQKLLNFQGRLDLIMQQIAMRKTQEVGTTNGSETIYVESSSDDNISEDGLDIMDNTNESGSALSSDETDEEESDDDEEEKIVFNGFRSKQQNKEMENIKTKFDLKMADDPWDDWEAAADAGLEPKPVGSLDDHEKNKQIWQEANSYVQPEITRTDSTRTEYVPQLRILKRPKNPGSTTTTHPSHLPINSNATFTSDSGSFSINSKQTKSLADREAEYIAARQKIFGHTDVIENNNENIGGGITGDGGECKTQKGKVIEDSKKDTTILIEKIQEAAK
ncbi:38864_t:CDS:10 [Gigaspora margarita]|uniref:38864_t:CDS:1 n=2 Tax=Gigaspora margarita TaxID=4874 RepID=A0ABN7VFK3_GIGMA|nr:38864_t:CDS:10 [Gigaspora margarita]